MTVRELIEKLKKIEDKLGHIEITTASGCHGVSSAKVEKWSNGEVTLNLD